MPRSIWNFTRRRCRSTKTSEDCLKRAKSEAGLADYEVRTWPGWYHHQALSLIAAWFLTEETRRGKKTVAAITVPQIRETISLLLHRKLDHESRNLLAPKRIDANCKTSAVLIPMRRAGTTTGKEAAAPSEKQSFVHME